VDPAMLHMIGGALLTWFLSYVAPELNKTIGHELATAAGSATHDVVGDLRGLMGGKKPIPEESAKGVETAQAAAPKAPPAQIVIIINNAQTNLRDQLATVMPDSAAASLAAQVSQQAARMIDASPAQWA